MEEKHEEALDFMQQKLAELGLGDAAEPSNASANDGMSKAQKKRQRKKRQKAMTQADLDSSDFLFQLGQLFDALEREEIQEAALEREDLEQKSLSKSRKRRERRGRQKTKKKEADDEEWRPSQRIALPAEGAAAAERYPKRNAPRVNYAAIDEAEPDPADDRLIHCRMCDTMQKDECWLHPFIGVINNLRDKRHLFGEPACISIHKSKIHGIGVFTRCALPVNVRFGPYHGVAVNQETYKGKRESGYAWIVEELGEAPFYVDAEDRLLSNWMRFVNCARFEEEQNLIAFQYRGAIFYKTYKEVPAGAELLVFYGVEYARDLGIRASKFGEGAGRRSASRSRRPAETSPAAAMREAQDVRPPRAETSECGDERDDQCEACDKGFKQSGDLRRHERTHTDEKPYTCDVCKASFSQLGHLRTHERTHTGEKPYTCDVCKASFSESGTLRSHERTHTGEKPYSCNACGASFTTSSCLRAHERRKHIQ